MLAKSKGLALRIDRDMRDTEHRAWRKWVNSYQLQMDSKREKKKK